MKPKDIILFLWEKGKKGCSEIERYIDIGKANIIDGRKELVQLIHWKDERGLAVCWLDKYEMIHFTEYRRLKKATREAISSYIERIK